MIKEWFKGHQIAPEVFYFHCDSWRKDFFSWILNLCRTKWAQAFVLVFLRFFGFSLRAPD